MMMDPMQASPKSSLSSPRGNRSPVVPRQDSTGTLKTTIALGKTGPSIVHTGPFYLMKELPCPSELTGATNLMAFHDLEHSYNKFSGKKVKDQLSCFLPNLPGSIDSPGRDQDNSSTLRSVIEKPPIVGKELHPLSQAQLAGFRLYPGPLPEQYRFMNQSPSKKKHKQKKHKHKGAGEPGSTEGGEGEIHEKKKKRKHDDDRRKKKKEKKKKKQKHSPEHVGAIGPTQ